MILDRCGECGRIVLPSVRDVLRALDGWAEDHIPGLALRRCRQGVHRMTSGTCACGKFASFTDLGRREWPLTPEKPE